MAHATQIDCDILTICPISINNDLGRTRDSLPRRDLSPVATSFAPPSEGQFGCLPVFPTLLNWGVTPVIGGPVIGGPVMLHASSPETAWLPETLSDVEATRSFSSSSTRCGVASLTCSTS